jgi:hypothetical protein
MRAERGPAIDGDGRATRDAAPGRPIVQSSRWVRAQLERRVVAHEPLATSEGPSQRLYTVSIVFIGLGAPPFAGFS